MTFEIWDLLRYVLLYWLEDITVFVTVRWTKKFRNWNFLSRYCFMLTFPSFFEIWAAIVHRYCIFLCIGAEILFVNILRLIITMFILLETLPLPSFVAKYNIPSAKYDSSLKLLGKSLYQKDSPDLCSKLWSMPSVIVGALRNQHIVTQLCRFNEYW